MNDEIKEKIPFNVRDVLEYINSNILWNYITNLQEELEEEKRIEEADLKTIQRLEEENERLKDNRDWWKDRFFGQQEYDDSHRITAIEYKKRIDEVIEYIKSLCYIEYKNEWFTYGDDLNPKYIVNVLQNGCEENVSDRD